MNVFSIYYNVIFEILVNLLKKPSQLMYELTLRGPNVSSTVIHVKHVNGAFK